MLPPDALIQDCPIPEANLVTNADLIRYTQQLYYILQACNLDKQALRDWKEATRSAYEDL